jgi:hypothetical protein
VPRTHYGRRVILQYECTGNFLQSASSLSRVPSPTERPDELRQDDKFRGIAAAEHRPRPCVYDCVNITILPIIYYTTAGAEKSALNCFSSTNVTSTANNFQAVKNTQDGPKSLANFTIIKNFSEKYHLRLSAHPNQLTTDLLKSHCVKRLKRFNPSDLTNRFNSH